MDYNENVKLRTGGMYVPRDKSTLSIEMGKRMAIQRKKLRLTQEMRFYLVLLTSFSLL